MGKEKEQKKYYRLKVLSEERAIYFLEQAAYKQELILHSAEVVHEDRHGLTDDENAALRIVKIKILLNKEPHELFITTINYLTQPVDEEGHIAGPLTAASETYLESREHGFLEFLDDKRLEFLDGLPAIYAAFINLLNKLDGVPLKIEDEESIGEE